MPPAPRFGTLVAVRAPRQADHPRARGRRLAPLLAALLACGPRQPPDDPEPEVRTAGEPLSDDTLAQLRALARAGGRLYWRLPGPDGPRCEPWRLVADPDDPDRGRLVLDDRAILTPDPSVIEGTADAAPDPPDTSDHSPAPGRPYDGPAAPAPPDSPPLPAPAPPASPALRLAYRLAEGHLSLTAPEHERPVPAAPNSSHAVGVALTCVFAGLAVTTRGPEGPARRLVLDARERFFLDPDACAAAGPPEDPPGPAEVRPLGCASALADPATRARLAAPAPAGARDPTPALRRQRRLFLLRRGPDGAARCEAWRHHVEDDAPRHGVLTRDDRDDRGRFTRIFAYEAGPGVLTLQGPTEVWRPRIAGRRAEVVRARGCLITRPVADVSPDAITIGQDPWYRSRRACEAARAAGAAPRPAPSCD